MKKLDSIALKVLGLQVVILLLAVAASWGTDGTGLWGNVVAADVLVMALIIASRVVVSWTEGRR